MVTQTNLYATQVLINTEDVASSSRLHGWNPTDRQEMKKFLGMLGYMGLVKMPNIRHYWRSKPLYKNWVSTVMSRNRFELLLKLWHFTNNEECPEGDRLYKVEPFVDMIVQNFQNIYTPGEVFCVDESLIPFRGKLLMKQYIPMKAHKYGVKVFKLCSSGGYTWNLKIYGEKVATPGMSVPTKVVLNSGRTVVTDNFYTSLELANILLDKQTHLLGTLRSNRRGNPKDVISKKLKVGELIAKENARGICVIKWKDKRDVLMLSTKHNAATVEIQRRNATIRKPVAIVDYNTGKSSIDVSDQMASYNTALRKTIKWYRKISIEILLGTSIVNAHFLYKEVTKKTISITEFREMIITDLLNLNEEEKRPAVMSSTSRKRRNTHTFAKKEGPAAKVRKYCRGCYIKKQRSNAHKNTVKKVTTYCLDCDDQPHYCLDCFTESHK